MCGIVGFTNYDGNMRNEYITENSRNYQKYVIENDEK